MPLNPPAPPPTPQQKALTTLRRPDVLLFISLLVVWSIMFLLTAPIDIAKAGIVAFLFGSLATYAVRGK